eukprot:5474152-Prymnesium_polylepis.1
MAASIDALDGGNGWIERCLCGKSQAGARVRAGDQCSRSHLSSRATTELVRLDCRVSLLWGN